MKYACEDHEPRNMTVPLAVAVSRRSLLTLSTDLTPRRPYICDRYIMALHNTVVHLTTLLRSLTLG